MAYLLGLVVALVGFWLAMSGYFKPLLLSFGTASIAISVVLASRLGLIDREGVPYVRILGFIAYFPWLMWEVAKANWVVVQACLKAELDISPALVKVKTQCSSDLAKVTFANSITLTPGTVTISVDGDKLLVHGLYEHASQPEDFAEMDRRSAIAADGRKAVA